MKIAIDVRPLLEDVPGGVRTYTEGLLADLAAGSHTVTAWWSGRRAMPQNKRSLVLWQSRKTSIPNSLLNPLMRFVGRPRVDKLIERRSGRPDWFVMPNPNFIALSRRTKLAVVFHDLSFEVNPAWYSPKERLWHKFVRPRELAARADRVIAVSEWTKRDLMEVYGVPEKKIVVVPPSLRGAERSLDSARDKLSDDGVCFLYLGSISRRKNVLGLIRAFELLDVPAAKLVLAGPDGFGAGDVKRAIASSRARDRIKFLGVVAEEFKNELFASVTAFVYPSFYEGFGIPVAEAMAAGLPVIVSDRAALPEVAGGAGLLVDPYDVSTITAAMKSVVDDGALREQLRAASLRRADKLCQVVMLQDLLNPKNAI